VAWSAGVGAEEEGREGGQGVWRVNDQRGWEKEESGSQERHGWQG
jgi:hypothetical protein